LIPPQTTETTEKLLAQHHDNKYFFGPSLTPTDRHIDEVDGGGMTPPSTFALF